MHDYTFSYRFQKVRKVKACRYSAANLFFTQSIFYIHYQEQRMLHNTYFRIYLLTLTEILFEVIANEISSITAYIEFFYLPTSGG